MRMLRCLAPVALCFATTLQAQHHAHGNAAPAPRDSLSGMLTGVITRASPAEAGLARTEALVTQPMLMLRRVRRGGAIRLSAMLNAERWTMPDGEPVAGIWGEGFIDRRHPHTVVHELVVTGVRRIGSGAISLAGGRGIVPFGTDDPMVRPFTKYPANHHYTQVLERLVLSGAIRVQQRASLEVAAFNGDEPLSPTAAPQWRRFGDSRAARLTLWPEPQFEVQGSVAAMRSPEFVTGGGLDQRKWSASGRWTPAAGAVRYVLAEWARTEDRYRERALAGYGTGLAELLATRGRVNLALRAERTSRHEEERLLDPFRTARPPGDLTIKGITRWQLLSAQLSTEIPAAVRSHGRAFVEVTHARSTPRLQPVLLDPRDVIGANSAWHLSVGLRLGLGAMPARVGRYGAAAAPQATETPLTMAHPHR